MLYNMPVEGETLTFQVERITFSNPQNGYCVLKTTSKGHHGTLTVVGNFGPIHPGEEIRAYGIWACHPQFGQQFHAFKYSVLKPATLKGIEKYLGSGLIKGVGPVTAKRLVAEFGLECLEVIEKDPGKLTSCEGIGPYRAEKIIKGWHDQKAIQDVMIFLQGHGISTAYAVRIFKTFGNSSVSKVADDPYILANEIKGIGFKTADKIASEFGITGPDPRRLRAGIQFVLFTALEEGNLFLEIGQLKKKAQEILSVGDENALGQAISELTDSKRLIIRHFQEKELVYLPFAFRSEEGSVEKIAKLLKPLPRVCVREERLNYITEATSRCGVTLSDLQQYAVELSLQERFLIITGGPGTGKTTALKAVVEGNLLAGRKLLLASPTGRAAKRLSEVTGHDAMTIHRLLEFSPIDQKFKHDQNNPLDCDVLIVDEASMIDMELFYALLKAIPGHGSLILVGDVDQLPSVGPGLVLKGLIQSEVVPMIRLETIFRQAEASMIITNAHRINRGTMPILVKPDGKTTTDCYFLEIDLPEEAIPLLKNVVSTSLPKRFGYHPLEDIQVLSPMNRGTLGIDNLNKVLQEALNPAQPGKAELNHLHRTYRVGDKVIQTRNNYDLEVFNGDIGFVRGVESEDQEMTIDFPQGLKTYQTADMIDLSHAFAVTVHKAQGSEYKAVVLILTTQHYMMLQRNLVYTGMTRAKKTLVLIGSKKALIISAKNDRVKERNTVLRELLAERYPKWKFSR